MRVILALFITGALAMTLPFIPFQELGAVLIAAQPVWVIVALLANALIYPLWVLQWQLLAPRENTPPWPAMSEIVAASAVTNTLLFKAAGVASAAVMLVARGRLSVPAAASILPIDQLLVAVTKAVVLIIAVLVAPMPQSFVWGVAGFVILIALLSTGALALAHRPGVAALMRTSPNSLLVRSAELVGRFALGLNVLRSPGRGTAVLLLAFAKKAAEIASAYAVLLACGITVSPLAAVVAVAAVGVTTALPVVPGNVGVFTATAFVAYTVMGIPTAAALAAGLLQHAVEIVPSLLFGYGTLLANRLLARLPKERSGA